MKGSAKFYLIVVLILLSAIAALLIHTSQRHNQNFISYQSEIAGNSVAHARKIFDVYLNSLRYSVQIFAGENRATILKLAQDNADARSRQSLQSSLDVFFPNALTFTIADSRGEVLLEDKAGLVGESCRYNLRLFAVDRTQSDSRLQIHSDKHGYHFDLMTDMPLPDGRIILFFVTFKPDDLVGFIKDLQHEGHSLYVIKNDGSNLIEIASGGAINKLDRDKHLSSDEVGQILARQAVKFSQWDIVDVIDPEVFREDVQQIYLQSLSVFILFATLSLFSLVFLLRLERQKDQARESLVKHRSDLESQIKNRTHALVKANERLEYLSLSDGLTGIANRRHFDTEFSRELGRANRENKPLSLLLFDIDWFKRYNDSVGHLAGDDCLKQIAQSVSKEFKRGGDLTARYGGEEFAVILPGTDADHIEQQAERLRKIIWHLDIEHPDSDIADRVTVSVGGSCLKVDQYKTDKQLIDEADEALYAAKSAGRNCVKIYQQ